MNLLLKDNTHYTLTDEDYNRYLNTYRNIDLDQQILEMESWCIDNPQKRKTRVGVKKFINLWLSRANKENRSQGTTRRTRDTTLEQDLNNRDWAY